MPHERICKSAAESRVFVAVGALPGEVCAVKTGKVGGAEELLHTGPMLLQHLYLSVKMSTDAGYLHCTFGLFVYLSYEQQVMGQMHHG